MGIFVSTVSQRVKQKSLGMAWSGHFLRRSNIQLNHDLNFSEAAILISRVNGNQIFRVGINNACVKMVIILVA